MEQHFALNRSVKPTSEPITLANARLHLRVTPTGNPLAHPDDDLITRFIKAARQKVERDTGNGLLTQTWIQYLDAWPGDGVILLARTPVQSITSIQYVDTNGDAQTVDAADYRTDLVSEPARITPAFGESWPSSRGVINAVYVTFVVGYDSGSPAGTVPEDLENAVYMLMAHYYEHREAAQDMTKVETVPLGYARLIDEYILRV